MADKKAPGAPQHAPRRKRVAPTIDLTATEVPPPPASESPAEPPPQEAASAVPPEQPSEPPPAEEPALHVAEPAQHTLQGNPWAVPVAAGVAGGVIASVIFGALWYGEVLPVRGVASSDNGAQLAALQRQIQDLQKRPAPTVDTKAVDALTQRVATMEDSLRNLPKGDSSVVERLAAAENAMKSLGVALTALNQRNDDAAANASRAREQADAAEKAVAQLRSSVQDAAKDAPSAATPAQVDALTQRLVALEQTSKTARAELDKTIAGEKATRLALSAAALRDAVTSGAPFSAALAQAKALGASDRFLAPLAPFAASGVPSAAVLAQDLRALLPQMLRLSGAATSGSFLDRLQANASKLVRVTPVDAPPGDDLSAVLARLEVDAARADIAGALADIAKLPEATRAPAQAWMVKAKAREAALAAARDFAADASRALGPR